MPVILGGVLFDYLIYHRGYYIIWNASRARPIARRGYHEDDLLRFFDRDNQNQVIHVMILAQQHGIINLDDNTPVTVCVEEFIRGNRAGYQEQELSLAQIYSAYCVTENHGIEFQE